MITEVSPAPKIYMFYALFQTVGVRAESLLQRGYFR